MIVDPEAAREARQRELEATRFYATLTGTTREEPAVPEQPITSPELPHADGIPWRPRDLTQDRGW
jgi:hypothetical protein